MTTTLTRWYATHRSKDSIWYRHRHMNSKNQVSTDGTVRMHAYRLENSAQDKEFLAGAKVTCRAVIDESKGVFGMLLI